VTDPVAEELAFVELHCHSSASYDSLSAPEQIVRAAASRGLTHLAITDHERIDAAVEARELAPPGLTVIVGEEIRSTDGDVIGLFLERAVPAGLSALETIAAIHEQGGLAGIPHPFDRFRFSGLVRVDEGRLARLLEAADYIEAFNARVPYAGANERAAVLARERGLPWVAASDAHTIMEVGVSCTRLQGRVSSADDMLAALADAMLLTGRASLAVRGVTPAVRLIQHLRGNRPRRPALAQQGARR
jgi:predicted metal-dependent phosphoesterase TrpH